MFLPFSGSDDDGVCGDHLEPLFRDKGDDCRRVPVFILVNVRSPCPETSPSTGLPVYDIEPAGPESPVPENRRLQARRVRVYSCFVLG